MNKTGKSIRLRKLISYDNSQSENYNFTENAIIAKRNKRGKKRRPVVGSNIVIEIGVGIFTSECSFAMTVDIFLSIKYIIHISIGLTLGRSQYKVRYINNLLFKKVKYKIFANI